MSDAWHEISGKGAIRVELTDVPFFPQTDYFCGPAALATILVASGIPVTPEELVPQVYLPGRQGSLQVEVLAAARAHGVLATEIPGNFSALLSELEAGNPVLVLQNLGLNFAPSWHYAVVVGYEADRQSFLLRSGDERLMRLESQVFERTWQRASHWAMVVTQPTHLPVSASKTSVSKALLGLERSRPNAALLGYQAAVMRWPEDPDFQVGLGNVAYRLGDLERSRRSFEQVLMREPGHVPARNNMANVLLKEGRLIEAKIQAMEAAKTEGPWQRTAISTLQEIETALQSAQNP